MIQHNAMYNKLILLTYPHHLLLLSMVPKAIGTTARTTNYGGIQEGYRPNLRRIAQAMHRQRISLGHSRQPKKAIYHPQNLLLKHKKPLRVV